MGRKKKFIEEMKEAGNPYPEEVKPETFEKNLASLIKPEPVLPAPPVAQYFKVLKTAVLKQPNGYEFVLPEGQVISSAHYNMAFLNEMGVPLEPTLETKNPRRAKLI